MKKGIVAIGIGVVGSLCLPFASVQAVTNSWIFTGSDFWDTQSRWSVTNFPTITDAADLIINATTKTVTIDDNDTLFFQNSLTISNLTVGGTGSSTNTLSLNNMTLGGAIPLHILNVLTITNGGVLQITNSMLQVDGTFNLTGAMRIFNGANVQVQNAIIATNAVLQFALGTNSSSVVVSSNLTLGGTVNIINGGGFTSTTYTVFTYGGSLTNNGLTIGTAPSNFTFSVDTSTLGQIDLVVSAVATGSSSAFAITSIAQQTNDVLITWSTTAVGTTNVVQVTSGTGDGSYSNNFVNLSGNIVVTSSTTNYLDSGGATNTPSRFYRILLVGGSQGITDTDGDGIPDVWMQQYFGHPTGQAGDHSLAGDDADGDGLSNLSEYLSGTNPTNSMSGLRIISVLQTNNDIAVTWLTAAFHTNILQVTSGDAGNYSNNFTDIPASQTIVGGSGDTITNYVDVGSATNTPSRFYRVRLVP